MKRRTFCGGACAGLLAGPVFGATDLPLPVDIPDREGESTLLPAASHGPRPLIYMSHRLGGIPAEGHQKDAPWILFGALQRAGWNILRSADAGPDTYGNDKALAYCERMCRQALERIDWDGRLFSLGISMGALPALQMTWKDLFDHPVIAVATIAGATNLSAIHKGPEGRRERIEKAYAVSGDLRFEQASSGHDPLNDFQRFCCNAIPLLAIASDDDDVLPINTHSGPMVQVSRDSGSPSELFRITGGHIGPEHFTPQIAARIADFFSAQSK